MSGKVFLNTNVLAYALDAEAAAGCDTMYTEDLNAGQTILGVSVRNPLA